MLDKSFTGARIFNYQPDGPAKKALSEFVGEPCLLVRTESPRWTKYAGKAAQCSLLVFRTPDGPVLVISWRLRDCFLFVVCDLGDPEVCQLLDSWKARGSLQTRTVFGEKVVTALEPLLGVDKLDSLRVEVRNHDEHAFIRSSLFLRELGILEQYATHEATRGSNPVLARSLTVEVHMLATERFADATLEYFMQHRPETIERACRSAVTHRA
jgi:hypothetical protein